MGMKPFQGDQDNPDSFQEMGRKAQGAFSICRGHMQMTVANTWIQAGWKGDYDLGPDSSAHVLRLLRKGSRF